MSAVYPVREPFPTRWNDNDQYGHLNNTVYYAAMDTAVNAFMIREGGLDPVGVDARNSHDDAAHSAIASPPMGSSPPSRIMKALTAVSIAA